MKACVTGATGFVGAHVTRLLAERGDEPRVVYRNAKRLANLPGIAFKRAKADVLDFAALRRALRGADVLFHTAGFVGSSPADAVWALNARAPVVAVEAAAAAGVPRVVLTSTISAIGPANGRPADESREYPRDWLGLTYPDSKHVGEVAALEAAERHGVELVIVNPAYVLGVPVDRSQPGETSTRIVGNYLRGRLPGVIAGRMNFVDVEDVARGHLLAAERGRPGERYILGGENTSWPDLIDRVAAVSATSYPILVLPRGLVSVARLREALNLPGVMSTEGYELMAQDWRFSSRKAERELGYRARPLGDTIASTVAWYQELIAGGAFGDSERSGLSVISGVLRRGGRLGVFRALRAGQAISGVRFMAGV